MEESVRRRGGRIMVCAGLLIWAGVGATVLGQEGGAATQPASAPAEGAAATQPAFQLSPTQAAAAEAAAEVDPFEEFLQKSKKPAKWISFGADLRVRHEHVHNGVQLNARDPNHELSFTRYRPRFWTKISPFEQLELNARLIWEGRYWANPDSYADVDHGEVLFDELNAVVKKPFDLPVTITGGRQTISLGDRWLVFEGGPLDGSRTIYFDAVRFTTELTEAKTTLDLIYIDQDAESEHWVSMLKSRDTHAFTGAPHTQRWLSEQDERGAIFWLTNRSLEKTMLEGFFIYKNDKPVVATGNNADIYTFGAGGEHKFDEHWQLRSTVAYQFGHKNDSDLNALGANNRLSYHFNDKHKNWLRMDYEYMSGDKPGGHRNEAFDPLWGRWPRFSELYIYTNAGETRLADPTNLHRVAWGWSCSPMPKLEMATDYHLLFADQTTFDDLPKFTESGCFRGQLLTWLLKYQINTHLAGHTIAELLLPGDYYADSNNDAAVFVRTELVFSW